MTTKDYAKRELAKVSAMLNSYYEWGYSPDLQGIVDALNECEEKLKKIANE